MPQTEISLIRDTSDQGELLALAKLAEQTERYEDMMQAMKKIVVMAKVLSVEERNLLSVAYKNIIGSRRATWRIISSTEESDEVKRGNKEFRVKLLKDYREKVEQEIREISAGVLDLLENHLIPNAEKTEAKVFFYKMRGDYYRYLTEITEGEARKEPSSKALAAYNLAQEASSDLQPTHPIRLGLGLNFSVFYYEILDSPDQACKLAKKAFDEAISLLGAAEGDGQYKESTLIMQLLKDNLMLWTAEIQGEGGDAEQ